MKSIFLFFFLLVSCSSIKNDKPDWIIKQNIQVKDGYLDIRTVAQIAAKEIDFCPDETISVAHGQLPGEWRAHHKAFFRETNEGIINYHDGDDTILYTLLQPTAACKMFPVPRSEIARMHFELTIVLPKHWKIVGFAKANLISENESTKTWSLISKVPIPYMNFAFFAGTIDTFGNHPSYYSLKRKSKNEITKIMNEYLMVQKMVADYFSFIPGDIYDLISLPQFEPGAMENFGAITITDDLFDEAGKHENSSSLRKFVLLHESIHQIVGNCLSPKTKGQVFLVEGLTQYFSNEISKGRLDFKNPFQGPLPKNYSIDINDGNIKSFFSKSSYNLGLSIFDKISTQRGRSYLSDKIFDWYKRKGCSQFDYSSLDPMLKRKTFNSDL